MEETLVFIDEGFLYKLTKRLGDGKRLKFDKFDFAEKIAKKQNLICKHLFYYTAPPFQSENPSEKERRMREGYDKFISMLSKNTEITIREGRCQKIINQRGEVEYKQKGVDVLLTIDLSHLKQDFPKVNKIILVSSDTDFCPIIKDIKKRGNIEVILYTYFDRTRNSKICREIEELLKRKNEMYGDENIVKIGKEGITVRLTEKIERLKHLLESKINPAEETIEDIWKDIAGYGITGLMLQRGRWK